MKKDILIVNIEYEAKSFQQTYRFLGEPIEKKNSIHFTVREDENGIDIIWSGATPL